MSADVRALLEPTYPGRSIADLRTRPYPYATSFRLDEVTIDFEDGGREVLILKDFDRESMLPDASLHRPVEADQGHHEIETYRRVLAPAGLGPRCQAAVADASIPRYWLLTERVRGVELWQIGDITVWECVVRWLAQLHAAFGGQRDELLTRHPQLPVLDATWFDDWTDRAMKRLSTSSDTRAEALRRGLRGINLAIELAALPATFIHGEFYPSNVMIGTGDHETKVYPVDWETAAIGPAMIDLAAITSGWDKPTEARLVGIYGLPASTERALLLCRLYLAIRWVSWPEQWTPPREHRRDWMGSALELVERLR